MPIALIAYKYAPNKGYALNKQTVFHIYTYHEDYYSIATSLHLLAFDFFIYSDGNPSAGMEES